MKTWGGRFRKKTARELEALGDSIHFDRRLFREDIRANRAYARELQRQGHLTEEELSLIDDGLADVGRGLETTSDLPDEDIHTAVERLLREAIGDVASKLPMGRSRNDLSATGVRLYLAAAIEETLTELRRLQEALVDKADSHRTALLPGYTHLRRGQPVVFAQYLLAYFWSLERDRERLSNARTRTLRLPLGAGALAGNPFGIDRKRLAEELDFLGVLPNSIDAVSSRDYQLEFLAASAILGTHLSRMSEDLILWSTAEFDFVSLDESFTTGSSLMPQKQNPDGLELIRGKSGRLVGNLVSLLTTVKGLPTGYQRDLQEDKEPLFDSVDTLHLALPVMTGTIATLIVRREAMAAALSPELLATDLADYLVLKAVPFRDAHRIVGEVLAHAAAEGVGPDELATDALRAFSDRFEDDVRSVWDPQASVDRRTSEGGVAAEAIADQLEKARRALEP